MFYPVYERALDIRLVDMSCFLFVCLFVCLFSCCCYYSPEKDFGWLSTHKARLHI